MTTLGQVPTPALVLDLDRLERNLDRVADRCRELGVSLRPHIKTHKCIEIAERQRARGARGITVSTMYEARVFADHGFDDITWAFPVVLSRIPQAAELARRVTLRLVVDSAEAVAALERSGHPFHVWLKVDCGYHRAGVDPHSESAVKLARAIHQSGTLVFDGLLSHSGHAYHGHNRAEVARVAEEERSLMVGLAERLRGAGIPVPGVSVGSTPGISAVESLAGVTEFRAGNYALFDYSQTVLGTCAVTDCAVTLIASVVSSQPGTNHCVIDAGALALSKDTGSELAPRATMGEILSDYASGELRPDARLVGLSQEHGIVNAALPVGTRLRILPNHSCLTVAHWDEYVVVKGDNVVDRWRVWGGRD